MVNPETVRYRRFLSPAGDTAVRPRFAATVAGQPVPVTGAGGYIGSAPVPEYQPSSVVLSAMRAAERVVR
jgi:hypothetical protein